MPTPRPRPFFPALDAFGTGRGTPRAFLESCLEELERWEPTVGAFTHTDVEGARRAADAATSRWKAGRQLSRIDGMPVGVKDNIDTDDMPTGNGSPLYDDYRPRFSAASAQALREAGAVILGKTVTTEFASTQPRGTRNPWDLARTPGGSSSGSAAAVATGMVAGALGTQVVGSIIRPAGFCGVYGFKPSFGGINRGGSLDFLSQSCTGSIAASLEDAWILARAVAAEVGGDPGYPGLGGPLLPPAARAPRRLGLLRTAGWSVASEDARGALEAAAETLRRAGVEVLTPETSASLAALEGAVAEALPETLRMLAWEWRWPLNAFVMRDAAALSPSSRERAKVAREVTREAYASLLQRRREARALFAKVMANHDALIGLTAPGAAPVGLETTGNPICVVPGSYLGGPVVAMPLLRDGGLPLGLQVLGKLDEDEVLFAHASWIEGILRS
jgi:Asp-tRNA(Asn)/Glu-tRNA(Gln) amidotransferase A subunit family amidase